MDKTHNIYLVMWLLILYMYEVLFNIKIILYNNQYKKLYNKVIIMKCTIRLNVNLIMTLIDLCSIM